MKVIQSYNHNAVGEHMINMFEVLLKEFKNE